MTFPVEKSGEKIPSARRDGRSLSSLDRFLPGKRQFPDPFKDTYTSRRLERDTCILARTISYFPHLNTKAFL